MEEKIIIKVEKNATERLGNTELSYLLSKKSLTARQISKLVGCSEKDGILLATYMVCSSSGYSTPRVRTGIFVRSFIEVYNIPILRDIVKNSIFEFYCPDIDILKELFEFVEVESLNENN